MVTQQILVLLFLVTQQILVLLFLVRIQVAQQYRTDNQCGIFFVVLSVVLSGRKPLPYLKNGWLLNISAFSSEDTRMYFRNVLSRRWPVIFIIAMVGTPAL